MILVVIIGLVIACFGLVVFRGAPYVPTHKRWVHEVVKLVPKKGTFVDLGSGDGAVLLAAAYAGRKVLGIELNPLLVWLSRARLRQFGRRAEVRLGDFWRHQLPPDTSVVFVFLAGPFMNKLRGYLEGEATRLDREILCISYGFVLENTKMLKQHGPLVVQTVMPLYKTNSARYH